MEEPDLEIKLVQHLPYEVMKRLFDMLNVNNLTFGRDWTCFAGELNFNLEEVQNLQNDRNPTLEVIKRWERKQKAGMTIGLLLNVLKSIGRMDIYEDVKDCAVSTPTPDEYERIQRENASARTLEMTLLPSYDAMISFASPDKAFAEEILTKLEQQPYCFKICYPARDFIPGFNADEQTMEVIEKRCHKVIAIISSNYINCAECDFQAKVAFTLCKGVGKHKVIPIMYESCELPKLLKGLTCINYADKDHRDYFWQRLDRALKIKSL